MMSGGGKIALVWFYTEREATPHTTSFARLNHAILAQTSKSTRSSDVSQAALCQAPMLHSPWTKKDDRSTVMTTRAVVT